MGFIPPPNGCIDATLGGFFCAYVHDYLVHKLGLTDDQIENGGLTIQTTLDPNLQRSADQGVPIDVVVAEPLGAHTLLTGRYEQQQIRVIAPPDKEVAAGARIGIVPALSRLVWMDPDSGRAVSAVAAE